MEASHNEAPGVGKLFLSAHETERVVVVCYVPEHHQAEIAAQDWIAAAVTGMDIEYPEGAPTAGKVIGICKADPQKNLYAIKMKDQVITQGINWLKEKKLFPVEDDDDDDVVYGDDAIGSF
eukprot:Filipodium_phascolosomae@DN931_c0_g1_i2.p1